jgi:hypothetical protein
MNTIGQNSLEMRYGVCISKMLIASWECSYLDRIEIEITVLVVSSVK